MTPDVVVDVGNSRIKWGRVAGGGIAEMVSLAHDDPAGWGAQAVRWNLTGGIRWATASVNPSSMDAFRRWVVSPLTEITDYRSVPIRVDVDQPERVGLDRLLGAVAGRKLAPAGEPVLTVDVGTAVTVNLVDAGGVFRGGAIFPGPRLMALALSGGTAALPDLNLTETPAVSPLGRNTAEAIRARGIGRAVMGGVDALIRGLNALEPGPHVFLTGGALGGVGNYTFREAGEVTVVPHLNLEGIRIAAEALP